ncbi:hypothetical protein [Limosilactobacillus reuteri]|uniref:hypothetical protein n=1 Tax=Limosilactobacillus reuteri TaxID=1598 RepID=UPI001C5AB25A|nr:hypothetical protein [Limosilactobacillus reuteri]MBW3351342.1 hypothetical protein [Limosilactobacillus reuteri]UUW69734.1 hypothetical protein NUJ10_11895 [Limosilactobacillus reuteri]
MSEAEELKEFKQKLELKYGRLAKKRLAKLSKVAKLDKQLIDMTDKEFDQQLNNWFNQSNSKNNQIKQQSQEHNN